MYKFKVRGVIQGVGFRPYIFRKARKSALVGYVKNVGSGVEIVVNVRDFISRLTDLPPLARISSHTVEEVEGDFSDFSILKSTDEGGLTELPPDIFTCEDCLRELRDRNDRRHNYYFITCTNCGPRYTMIEDYPYDRPYTAMKDYGMCARCEREYTDPMDRRYHAQTIACPDCGPKLRLLDGKEDISGGDDAQTVRAATELILAGELVSVKGVGGFHVCALASDEAAHKVKAFLGRAHKPFAMMVRDTDSLRGIAYVSDVERRLLEGPQRPIVVLKKRDGKAYYGVSELDSLGVMLPYTALHYMLFDYIKEPLLFTSCNAPGEPIATDERLGRFFLTHGRAIVNRCDDSVLKVNSGRTFFLRRSRGYVPLPVAMSVDCADTLAVGAESNNTVCAAKGGKCFISQYIGETSKYETLNYMRKTIETMVRLTRLKPEVVACDLHPTYNSTALARMLADEWGVQVQAIQHHKAHVASVAAEHGFTGYVGIAVDGAGYGEDDSIWGGEVFDVTDATVFKRIGCLQKQPQVGGDSAAIQPKKMLYGILSGFLNEGELTRLNLYDWQESRTYQKMIMERFNTPLTSSAGRILDAAAALLGVCDLRTYDGRPAMLLESAATEPLPLEPKIVSEGGMRILSSEHLFRFILENIKKSKGQLAATAQTYLASGLYSIASEVAKSGGKPIVLSGGVAYNRMISAYLLERGVYVNREIPSGDGGICYGQAYLANALAHRIKS